MLKKKKDKYFLLNNVILLNKKCTDNTKKEKHLKGINRNSFQP